MRLVSQLGRIHQIAVRPKVNKTLIDITAPGPAQAFVFLDEHENSIDDGHFGFAPAGDQSYCVWDDHRSTVALSYHRFVSSLIAGVLPRPRCFGSLIR